MLHIASSIFPQLTVGDIRGRLRLVSGLVLMAFVVCHLVAHATLLISIPFAQSVLSVLMFPWRTPPGTALLVAAFAVHYGNGLWSIYIRRSLTMSRWEWWQLGLGLSLPLLLTLHVIGTRVSEAFFGEYPDYGSVLVALWLSTMALYLFQILAVITVWAHGCIGLHFWLRTKSGYARWQSSLAVAGLLIPSFALAGFVAAGNQIVRLAATDPDTVRIIKDDANITSAATAAVVQVTLIALAVHVTLTLAAFAARIVRDWIDRRSRRPSLSHANGRRLSLRPGATVLETLIENGIPHAAVCGGRARCTTCRIMVTNGIDDLQPADGVEARALKRIGAAPGVRLACQVRPTAHLTIMPLLTANANAADGHTRGGIEGSERAITVMFVDLRDSTRLSETKLPYDVMFLLNLFFAEMTKALVSTNGHYSQFTGDGLMALYGLRGHDPGMGAADALRGARDMLRRLDALNSQLRDELSKPLQIGVGIHFSNAIVGAMGPPNSQLITAIGDMVNTCARLESLSKEYGLPIIISRQAAEAAQLDTAGLTLHRAQVRGRVADVEFYALDAGAVP